MEAPLRGKVWPSINALPKNNRTLLIYSLHPYASTYPLAPKRNYAFGQNPTTLGKPCLFAQQAEEEEGKN